MTRGAALEPPVAAEEFRDAMSRWATGVTVVTTADREGRAHGFTANSFSSVSLRPPLILVCLDARARCARAFGVVGWIAVHVLGREQEHLARRFAGKDDDKFAGLELLEGAHGLPLLPGPVARLECRVTRRLPAGDHTVLIAQVHRIWARPGRPAGGEPLVYHDRRFRGLT